MTILDLREPASALTHGLGALMALPGTAWLWRRGAGDRPRQWSLLVFGVALVACLGASAAFHGVHAPPERLAALRRLDHLGILVLIAGTYTPVAWNVLRDRWRRGVMGLAWSAVVAGSALHLGGVPIHPMGFTGLYLALGWGALMAYAEVKYLLTPRQLWPLPLGGLVYSLGAAVNLIDWPEPWPGTFGAHEVFHLFVLGGALCHYGFMLRVIAPVPTVELRTRPGGAGKVPQVRPLSPSLGPRALPSRSVPPGSGGVMW